MPKYKSLSCRIRVVTKNNTIQVSLICETLNTSQKKIKNKRSKRKGLLMGFRVQGTCTRTLSPFNLSSGPSFGPFHVISFKSSLFSLRPLLISFNSFNFSHVALPGVGPSIHEMLDPKRSNYWMLSE